MPLLEECLEIFVVTYNRATCLEQTLTALLASRFSRCAITVLDNHSTDATPEVCTRFQSVFPQLRAVRRRINTGLTPNYLQAVELSTKAYTWVLGDDDVINPTAGEDVIAEIEAARPDLIVVGAVGLSEWSLGRTERVHELLRSNFPYFYVTGWFTGMIFRTALFDSNCFQLGYKNADSAFPHFPFYVRCFEQDVLVYLAKTWIVVDRHASQYGRLGSEMLAGWVHSTRHITDRSARRAALRHGPLGQGRVASYPHIAALFFKAFGIHNVVRRDSICDVWFRCYSAATWDVRLALLPSFVHVLCPGVMARGVWTLLQRVRGGRSRALADYQAPLDEART